MKTPRSILACLVPCAPCFVLLTATSALAQPPAPAKPAAGAPAAVVPPPPAPPAPPGAVPPPPPSAPVAAPSPLSLGETLTGTTKEAYESGRLLFAVGDFAAALIKFTAAYDASKDVRLLWNVATCEGKLHHYARAVGLVRNYLKDGQAILSDQDKADADQTVRALEPLTSTMRITINEPGADVFLDDQAIGQSPIDALLVDIGVHKVRAHKAEFEESTQDVTVNGGAVLAVDLTLRPIVHEGRVNVHAGAKDAIMVDGQPSGVSLWGGTLRSGGHTLRVTAQGMLPYQTEVLVQDGQTREIDVTLNPEPSKGLPAWVWIAGGAVVAGGLGTGGYFLFKPTSKYEGPSGNLGPGLVQASAHVHF
jgi:hypothetical protein